MFTFSSNDFILLHQEELRAQALAAGRTGQRTEPAMELFEFCLLVFDVLILIVGFLSVFGGHS